MKEKRREREEYATEMACGLLSPLSGLFLSGLYGKGFKSWLSKMRGIKVNLKLSPTGQENMEHLH